MAWHAGNDPWAAALRGKRAVESTEPTLLFAGPAKLMLEQLELVMQDTYLGLDAAVTAFAKFPISESMKPKMNQFSKMCRHLAAATNLERHFTANGTDKWLHKAGGLLHELSMDQPATPPTDANLSPDAAAGVATAPAAPAAAALARTQVDEMMDQLKSSFMDGVTGQRCHFQCKLNEITDMLPSMIDAHIQPLKDMIADQNSRILAIETKEPALADRGDEPAADTMLEIAKMIDKEFTNKFLETFPKVFDVAIRKSDEGIATLTEEFERIASEVKRVGDRLDSIFHPDISIAVDNEPPLTAEELAAAGFYDDHGSDDYNYGGPDD